jgi:ribosomal 50S subunit-recycling heat shock protein
MKRFPGSYIAPLIGLISLLMPFASSNAAEKVTSTGFAIITSSINKDIFRTRAIENALQKIVLEAGQDLNSFSIVENGKVLLDQIQTRSAVKVLQYDIISETIKNKKYHVTVQALLGQEESTKANNTCKKSSVESIDFSLKITSNHIDFPAWANISKNWILNELTAYSFNPKLMSSTKPTYRKANTLSYDLFDKNEFSDSKENIYKMHSHIIFEQENKHNLLEKNIILQAKIKTKLTRSDKVFSELEYTQPYVIHQKLFNNSFLGATRGNWEKIKKHFSNLMKDRFDKQILALDCVNIPPRVFSKAGMPFVDFGRLDGIRKSDMFLIKSDSSKKTYLKIVEIKDHETQVEIVSQQENIVSINGKIVELVVGS